MKEKKNRVYDKKTAAKEKHAKHKSAEKKTAEKKAGIKSSKQSRSRFERVVLCLSCIFGLFAFCLFFAYLIRQTIFPEGRSAVLVSVAVMLCTLLPLLIYRPLARRVPRVALVLLCIYLAAALFFFVTFFIHCCETVIFPQPDPELAELPENAVIIVFGAHINGTQPALPLRYRLDCAYRLLEARPLAYCVVSGGQGADEVMPEAEAMKNYLVSRGIDEARILTEPESHDTRENIENSLRLIEERGLGELRIVCVSTRFHIPRIRMLCSAAGINDPLCYSADSPTAGSLIFSVIREYCSRARLVLGV